MRCKYGDRECEIFKDVDDCWYNSFVECNYMRIIRNRG